MPFDFQIFLVPGNKTQTTTAIKRDMQLVNRLAGPDAVVFNTERESERTRAAVSNGLGKGWKRVLDNENTMAYASNWVQSRRPSALLLAKQDPHKHLVSPSRYLDTAPLMNKGLKGITLAFKGTHLLSEANCEHTKVRGRAWREKMWPIQVRDVLDNVEDTFKQGVPTILAGDFNTGIHFTGNQLFELLQKRFGSKAVHVHNGGLDQIFLISAGRIVLSEVGQERHRNNASDHDMIAATIRVDTRR